MAKFLKSRREKKLRARASKAATEQTEAAPRITNKTVTEHREELLSSARKYIYPLQHSKHRIVVVSVGLFIAALIAFFSYCTIALYKLQSNSAFLYGVTKVVPFPIARIGSRFVAYENYLFELRHYTHYYENQQKLDFNSESGQQQLAEFKKRALQRVVDDAYVKHLAKERGISVSDQEVNEQISIVRSQNRLGSSDKVFEDVLREYWDWSVDDFKRSLRQQLLAQKVVAELDTETRSRADTALMELKNGADFAATAKKYSEDAGTKDAGGEYGGLIDKSNRDLPAKAIDAIFKLQPGQYSGIVNTGYTLEIVKSIEVQGEKVKAAHVVFNFKDITNFINDKKEKQPARSYVRLPEAKPTEEPVTPTESVPTSR